MNLDQYKLFAYAGIFSLIIAYASIFISIIHAPWFSFYGNWLSDLGNVKGSDVFFNNGLIISGVLGVIFASWFRKRSISGYAFLVSFIFLACVGLFPESAGKIHFIVSALFFMTGIIAVFMLSIEQKGFARHVFYAFVAIACISWLPFIDLGTGAIREMISAICISTPVIYIAFKRVLKHD